VGDRDDERFGQGGLPELGLCTARATAKRAGHSPVPADLPGTVLHPALLCTRAPKMRKFRRE
jgi:hypothetical protein